MADGRLFLDSLTDTVTAVVVRQNGQDTATHSDTSVVASPPRPPVLTVTVDKSNDADGNGAFTGTLADPETARGPGLDVAFRAVITNTSGVAVEIASLSDQLLPGQVPFGVCPTLIGTTLAPGASVTCNFTVAGYSPPAGSSLTDKVVAVVRQPGNPGNTATDDDDSKVITPPPGDIQITPAVLGDQLTQPLAPTTLPLTAVPTLPVTGTEAGYLTLSAVGLVGLGFGLRRMSRRSRRAA